MGFFSPELEDDADALTQGSVATAHGLADEFERLFPNRSPAAKTFLVKLRTFEKRQRAHQALIVTAQQTSRVTGQLDLRYLAEFALDQGLRLVDAERGLLVLYDDGAYRVTASRHVNLGAREGDNAISRSLLDKVVKSGEPLITTNVQDDPGFSLQESVLALSIRSVLAVPLMTQDKIIGAFYLDTQIMTRVFEDTDLRIIQAFSTMIASAIGVVKAVDAREALYLQMARSLVSAVEAKDSYTAGHSDRVGIYAQEIMRTLGYDESEAKNALIAGYLHDIGKIGINDSYVTKPGKLEPHERREFQKHTLIGVRILENVDALKGIMPAVRWHHEKLDGTGYPDGLKGAAIPLLARVMCVADAFDAMTTNRPYRKAMDTQTAIAELRACSSTQFDPQVVGALIAVLNSGKADIDQ